jgi:hypothetical protein
VYVTHIFDASSGTQLAKLVDVKLGGFVVRGPLVIATHLGSSQRIAGKMVDRPRRVQAYRRDGSRAWSRPVGDARYNGPFPPE